MPICNMTRNSKSVEISPFTKKRIVKVAFSVDFPHCGSLVLTFACKIYKQAYLGICHTPKCGCGNGCGLEGRIWVRVRNQINTLGAGVGAGADWFQKLGSGCGCGCGKSAENLFSFFCLLKICFEPRATSNITQIKEKKYRMSTSVISSFNTCLEP